MLKLCKEGHLSSQVHPSRTMNLNHYIKLSLCFLSESHVGKHERFQQSQKHKMNTPKSITLHFMSNVRFGNQTHTHTINICNGFKKLNTCILMFVCNLRSLDGMCSLFIHRGRGQTPERGGPLQTGT